MEPFGGLGQDAVAVGQGEGDAAALPHLSVRETEPEDDPELLLRDEVADEDLGPTGPLAGRVRRQGLDLDAVRRDDLEGDPASDDIERLPDLARDVVADARRVGDEVEVTATGRRHRLEQDLVEVLPDAERRRADPAGPELAGVPGELVAVGHPDVGQPVGQEEATVHPLLLEGQGDLLATAQPATAEVGAAAGVDRGEAGDRVAASLGCGPGRGHDDVDLLVVDDDGEPVVGLEPTDRLLDRLAGETDLRPGHRTGAVDDEGEVDRRPAVLAAGGRGDHLGEDVPLAAVGRTDEVSVGPGVGMSWLVLLEELAGDRDEAIDLLVLGPAERPADVEFDVGCEGDAIPLGSIGARRAGGCGRLGGLLFERGLEAVGDRHPSR